MGGRRWSDRQRRGHLRRGGLRRGCGRHPHTPAQRALGDRDVADGQLIVYRMPGIRGDQINATAMLFLPTQAPPAGGWPLVVWGHGTVGWAPECAPSVQLQEHGKWVDGPNAALLAANLRMNTAVVAPDYEGLGPVAEGVPEGHGYYELSSEGKFDGLRRGRRAATPRRPAVGSMGAGRMVGGRLRRPGRGVGGAGAAHGLAVHGDRPSARR